jgi:hypothetical protein
LNDASEMEQYFVQYINNLVIENTLMVFKILPKDLILSFFEVWIGCEVNQVEVNHCIVL